MCPSDCGYAYDLLADVYTCMQYTAGDATSGEAVDDVVCGSQIVLGPIGLSGSAALNVPSSTTACMATEDCPCSPVQNCLPLATAPYACDDMVTGGDAGICSAALGGCTDGFYMTQEQTCAACTQMANCAPGQTTCGSAGALPSSNRACTSCMSGYTIDPDTGACEPDSCLIRLVDYPTNAMEPQGATRWGDCNSALAHAGTCQMFCAPGFFVTTQTSCHAGTLNTDTKCRECAAGKYRAEPSSRPCLLCPPGTTTFGSTGSTECRVLAQGAVNLDVPADQRETDSSWGDVGMFLLFIIIFCCIPGAAAAFFFQDKLMQIPIIAKLMGAEVKDDKEDADFKGQFNNPMLDSDSDEENQKKKNKGTLRTWMESPEGQQEQQDVILRWEARRRERKTLPNPLNRE